MSPFDQARYERLLEGLDGSEVRSTTALLRVQTARIDAEYFGKQYLQDEKIVRRRHADFQSLSELGLTVDASAFYPSIEAHYGQGELPFLRVADVNAFIDWQGCTTIPATLCDQYPTLARVKPGDILLTKGGSIARVGLVTREAAASRDLIFIDSSKLSADRQAFLYLYFQSGFFHRALVRSSSQTAQPHLTITLVRELPVLASSEEFRRNVHDVVARAFQYQAGAIEQLAKAQSLLLQALGLHTWPQPDALSYQRSSRDAFAAGRLDAEHFQPRFAALAAKLAAIGNSERLGTQLLFNARGKQPEYADAGVPVINSKHVLRNEVRCDDDNRRAVFDADSLLIQSGDVLINGTGVGTIGRAAAYLHQSPALPDNHVTILRPSSALDPVYLAIFLNSLAGQLQVDQRLRGSSGQIELYPTDIAEFQVWVAPESLQLKIRHMVERGFAQRQVATRLLDAAKHAVEIAIEHSESAALRHLSQETAAAAGE